MTQADSVHSTQRPNAPIDRTRRSFLSTAAAGLAAGSAALTLASPPARAAGDPVFALIEAHRAAEAALDAAIRNTDEAIAGFDSLVDAAHEVEMSALDDLVDASPTTLAGVSASMEYLADASYQRIHDEQIWILLANLAGALRALEVTS